MEEAALTLTEAASRLGVTPQQVSQLLAAGSLQGPWQQPGARAPRNAPRVYPSSIQKRIAERALPRSQRARVSPPPELALRDDAHRLKIALDVARDQIALQRQQNERLTALLAETVEVLKEEQALARQADKIAEQYAVIATNHLAPDMMPDKG